MEIVRADRAEILEAFDKDQLMYSTILDAYGRLGLSECDCIVVLRPTKVRSLYCQMVGRGTQIITW